MKKVYLYLCAIALILSTVFPYHLFTDGAPEELQVIYPWLSDDMYYSISIYSDRYGVEKNLVFAIIEAESEGKFYATSHKGAIGYMQIMPFHYRGSKERLYNKDLNLMIGCRYFAYCLKEANGDIIESLKNYNAGPASKFYNIPYIKKVINNYMLSLYYEEEKPQVSFRL
jgi:hypothetical protein